ncbi:hypothetical protein JW926_18855, partial [Candidatus Sumerlaeota bacterium]|nr:hypothetical protein [Candidatus Sumerlaeota bacterium]
AESFDNLGGECSEDDANEWWITSAHVYFPYKPGDEPEGDIRDKPALTPFSTTPTYKWPNQILNSNPDAIRTFCSENVKDMDDFEDGIEPYDWLDPPQNDPPGETDIRWTSSNSQEEYGSTVELNVPVGGMELPVEWTITLNIDDDEDPCMADDNEKSPADETLYRVYYDHLARDMDNVSDLNKHVVYPSNPPDGNCEGAARHAYVGETGYGYPPWGGNLNNYDLIYEATPTTVVLPLIKTGHNRKDVFVINGFSCHHVNTCLDGTLVWEYNGFINSMKWGTATLEQFADKKLPNGENKVYTIRRYRCPDQ